MVSVFSPRILFVMRVTCAVEGADESRWLQDAGMEALSAKVEQGTPITEADFKAETAGFTQSQILAVKQRVDTLNEFVSVVLW